MSRLCKFCSSDISHKHFNSVFCNISCRNTFYSNERAERLKNSSIEYFHNKPTHTYVVCKICGHCDSDLSNHILKIHKISCSEYKIKYNVTVVKSEELCEKVRGDKNPGYQHGGKFSSFSDNFIHNDGSEHAKEKQAEVKNRMYSNGLGKKENKQNNIEYWTSRGYSVDDAKILVSERQKTFSLTKCIEKYGEVRGKVVWEERQKKWLYSYYNKTPNEIEEINRRKKSMSIHDLCKFSYKLNGIFYIIQLTNNHIKIGITTKSIRNRYISEYSKISKILLEETFNLQVAFMYEQILKKQLYHYKINKKECILESGWTETFNVSDTIVIQLFYNMKQDDIKNLYLQSYPNAIKYINEIEESLILENIRITEKYNERDY